MRKKKQKETKGHVEMYDRGLDRERENEKEKCGIL